MKGLPCRVIVQRCHQALWPFSHLEKMEENLKDAKIGSIQGEEGGEDTHVGGG